MIATCQCQKLLQVQPCSNFWNVLISIQKTRKHTCFGWWWMNKTFVLGFDGHSWLQGCMSVYLNSKILWTILKYALLFHIPPTRKYTNDKPEHTHLLAYAYTPIRQSFKSNSIHATDQWNYFHFRKIIEQTFRSRFIHDC